MKKIILMMVLFFTIVLTVNASGKKMNIDVAKINLNRNSKVEDISSNFDSEYNIDYDEGKDISFERNITEITNKITYLLLGNPNSDNGDYKEYANRKKELINIMYNPEIPKDENGDYIEDSPEYNDSLVVGINVPGMFKLLSEKNIKYKNLGTIKVLNTEEYVIVRTAVSDASIEMPNEDNPRDIDLVDTSILLTYFYKLYKNEYKLYWIMAETNDSVEDYFLNIEQEEYIDNNLVHNSKVAADLEDIYDYSKLNNLKNSKIEKIYNDNRSNIVILNTYSKQSVANTAVGFFISDGIIVTSWNYVSSSLLNGDAIVISNEDTIYEYDGFVTVNQDLDIAVIKLKENIKRKVTFGSLDTIVKEDPVIAITTKSGVSLSTIAGIMISKDNILKNVLPLSNTDGGSPLFNTNGEVVAMNTTRMINASISEAISNKYLIELQNKFKNVEFSKIKTIGFDKLKEEYYLKKNNGEIVKNNISDTVWNEYKKIGDIENTVFLNLLKVSYYNGVVSLRYENKISNLMSGLLVSTSFKDKLLQDGYRKVSKSAIKEVYENNKYRIVIMEEFDYLIILLARK